MGIIEFETFHDSAQSLHSQRGGGWSVDSVKYSVGRFHTFFMVLFCDCIELNLWNRFNKKSMIQPI